MIAKLNGGNFIWTTLFAFLIGRWVFGRGVAEPSSQGRPFSHAILTNMAESVINSVNALRPIGTFLSVLHRLKKKLSHAWVRFSLR